MDEMNADGAFAESPDTPGTGEPSETAEPERPFYQRAADAFFNPAQLGRTLKEHPSWAVAMLAGAVLATAMYVLIPADVWTAMQRQAMLRAGQNVQQIPHGAETFLRWSRYVGGFVGVPIAEFIFAGVITLIFSFILGDEGRYKQYLAAVSHAWLVTMVLELALVPLKIHQGDPRATVSVGTFFVFLPDGYLLKALTLLALSKLWTSLVLAACVSAIEPKRKFTTAATVLIGLNVVVAFGAALLPSAGG